MTTRTITTVATAMCEELPDLATIEVTEIGEGDSPAVAHTNVRDRTSMIRESVTTVSADQIQTVELQIERTDEMFDPVANTAFQATERLQIDCVPDTVEDIVVEVTEAGGTIQSVQFYFDEEVVRQLQNEVLTAAMERAQERAELIAATEGLELTEVQNVTAKGMDDGMESIIDLALDYDYDTDICPKPVSISESVEVTYEFTVE